MTSDGLFNLQKYVVKGWQFGRPLRLVPFGDVHRDNPAHCPRKWTEFLEYSRGLDDAVFLGMGDYHDQFSTSERAILLNPKLHAQSRDAMEAGARARVQSLAGELEHMRGRLIGLLSGNHFVQFKNDTTSDQLLAQKLDARFLGVAAGLRIVFEFRNKTARVGVDIFAHHGKGAGTTACGRFHSVERLVRVAEVDIYLMGHNHARGCFPLDERLQIAENGTGLYLRSRQAFIGRTGSFLKGYEPGQSSYVVDAALPPANLGWIEFTLTPLRIREAGQDRVQVKIGAVQ